MAPALSKYWGGRVKENIGGRGWRERGENVNIGGRLNSGEAEGNLGGGRVEIFRNNAINKTIQT